MFHLISVQSYNIKLQSFVFYHEERRAIQAHVKCALPEIGTLKIVHVVYNFAEKAICDRKLPDLISSSPQISCVKSLANLSFLLCDCI